MLRTEKGIGKENRMISIAVLGYGTVGSGVVEVLEKNKDVINQKQEMKSVSNMFLI